MRKIREGCAEQDGLHNERAVPAQRYPVCFGIRDGGAKSACAQAIEGSSGRPGLGREREHGNGRLCAFPALGPVIEL